VTQNSGPPKKFCSKKCKNKTGVDRRRKKMKKFAVDHLGGKCTRCGYNKCIAALEFHHRDPKEKEFGIGSGNTMALEKLLIELNKCELLCANCHRELHSDNSEPSRI